jgi:aspartyl/glutamyl-tRNA(Asn/Gln) amidotransferase C subunit
MSATNDSKPTIISEEIVKKMSNLAMIFSNPSEEFKQKYSKELSTFFDYAQDFLEIDTKEILPTDIIKKTTIDNLRLDEPSKIQTEKERIAKNIIQNFPQKQGNFLAIPKKIVS